LAAQPPEIPVPTTMASKEFKSLFVVFISLFFFVLVFLE
jgi:hypothetical protein